MNKTTELFTSKLNVFVLSHVMANVIENDVDYIDDAKAMMTYDDDDHQNYLLPYLLDEDQHQSASKNKSMLFFI
jgi:hypothetical protein